MVAKFRSWWRDKIKPSKIITIIAPVIIAIIVIYVVIRNGTGFDGYNQVSVVHTNGVITRTETSQPGKTLWDLLQLLIIPLVIAGSGYWFNLTMSRNGQRNALDNQQDTALKDYIDKMSELLLLKEWNESQPENKVHKIARTRTLTVLRRLDANRKSIVLQFLYENGLINKDKFIIDLQEADLSEAYLGSNNRYHGANLGDAHLRYVNLSKAMLRLTILQGANLQHTNLRGANLITAFLQGANLQDADLQDANLQGADLQGANLQGANLQGANLQDAHLRDTNLHRANLHRTNLRNTFLCGANLRAATVDNKQLDTAILDGATMPDGVIHP